MPLYSTKRVPFLCTTRQAIGKEAAACRRHSESRILQKCAHLCDGVRAGLPLLPFTFLLFTKHIKLLSVVDPLKGVWLGGLLCCCPPWLDIPLFSHSASIVRVYPTTANLWCDSASRPHHCHKSAAQVLQHTSSSTHSTTFPRFPDGRCECQIVSYSFSIGIDEHCTFVASGCETSDLKHGLRVRNFRQLSSESPCEESFQIWVDALLCTPASLQCSTDSWCTSALMAYKRRSKNSPSATGDDTCRKMTCRGVKEEQWPMI